MGKDRSEPAKTAVAGQLERGVRPLVERLSVAALPGTNRHALDVEAVAQIERLSRALHEIAEEWAGAECGEPVHAQEAYAVGLAKRMYAIAAEALRPNVRVKPPVEAGSVSLG